MKRSITLGLGLVVLAGVVPASAHHSLSHYDRGRYVTIEGTVKEFMWTNPHARIILVVAGQGGAVKEWDFEGGSINRLSNGGFNRGVIAKGDKIKVAYNPLRDGAAGGFFLAVTATDGKLYGAERLKGYSGAN